MCHLSAEGKSKRGEENPSILGIMCLFVSETLQNQLSTGKWGVNGIKAAADGTSRVSGHNSEMRTSLFLISSLDVLPYTSIHSIFYG